MLKFGAVLIALALWSAPYPAHALSPQHPPHTEAKGSAAIETRGTEAAPLIVKIAPAEKSKAEISNEQAKEKEALNPEMRLANLTGDLAKYTRLLFIATAILAAITAGLLGLGFMQAFDNKRSIKAAETAANAAEAQVKLGREEFIASHRPRIIVRNVRTEGFAVGLPIDITFMLINIGDSPANIKAIDARVILLARNRRVPNPLPLMGCLVPKERLVSGDFIVTGAATDFTAELRDTNALQGDEKFLCVVGCVYYRDDNGIDRRTGFARVCDILKDAGGFSFSEIGIGDEEYEYAY